MQPKMIRKGLLPYLSSPVPSNLGKYLVSVPQQFNFVHLQVPPSIKTNRTINEHNKHKPQSATTKRELRRRQQKDVEEEYIIIFEEVEL